MNRYYIKEELLTESHKDTWSQGSKGI